MTFVPIVERELRVAARRHGTYSTRLLVALAGLIVCGFFFLVNLRVSPQLLGRYLFQGLSWLALSYCLFAGRRWTADCLSEEKREGTLGLLFLTDLKGYDVVFGKLVATSLNGFYGLLAVFPVLALPLLMGGVTNAELWRIVLVLLVTFMFSLAAGILASAWSRDARGAAAINFLLLLLVGASLPALAGFDAYFSASHRIINQLLVTCPVYSLYAAFDTVYVGQKTLFWISIIVIHGLTWLLVGCANWIVPRFWRELPIARGASPWRDRWHDWLYGNEEGRKLFRKRLLDVNPFYWLASRVRFKPAGVWILLAFIATWWLFTCLRLEWKWFDESLSFTTALMLATAFKSWVAIECCQRLAEDRKIGALELLLSTPLSVGEILRGQLLALRRQFLKPLLVAMAIGCLLLLSSGRLTIEENTKLRTFAITGVIMLLIDIAALIGVGMVAGLKAKNPNRASISTIFRVLLLPWILFSAASALVSTGTFGSADPPGWKFYLALWFTLGILADVGFGVSAWYQLKTRFRNLAFERLGQGHKNNRTPKKRSESS
jgi:hypothetical protein